MKTTTNLSNKNIPSLNGLKIILSFMVFLCHWEQVVRRPGMYRVPFIHGGFPVAAFFILSGFLIGRKYVQQFRVFQPAVYRKFLFSRVSNIYILYVVSMIPHFIKAWLAITDGNYRPLLEKLLYNLTLTQTLFPNGTAFSINSVSWFLSCLVMVYCAFPLLAKFCIWLQERGTWAIFGSLAVCLVSVHLLEPVSELYASPVFRVFQIFSGMLIAQIPPLNIADSKKQCGLELIVLGACVLAYFRILEKAVTLVDTACCLFLIFVFGQNWNTVVSRILGCRIMQFCGRLSMPIFLIHGPILFLWGKPLYASLTCPHKGFVTGGICFAATVALSLIYLLLEKLVKRGIRNEITKTKSA